MTYVRRFRPYTQDPTEAVEAHHYDAVVVERDRLLAELEALRPDAERFRFVVASVEGEGSYSPPGIYFIEEDGRGMGHFLFGQKAIDAIDAARGASPEPVPVPVYRCHECNSTQGPDSPFKCTPDECQALARGIHYVKKVMGDDNEPE